MKKLFRAIYRRIIKFLRWLKILPRGKKIVVFARKNDVNLGDVIIGDAVTWMLKKLSKQSAQTSGNTVSTVSLSMQDNEHISEICRENDVVVFPGGGINSKKFSGRIDNILSRCKPDTEIFFNATGISKDIKKKKTIYQNVTKTFNDERVKQITTRGDFETAKGLITTPKKYPCELVLDPGIWAGEVYNIQRDPNAEKIGLGIIRPEIFEEQKTGIEQDEIFTIYKGLIEELENRGYKWSLFCNGTEPDYEYGEQLLDTLGIDKETHLEERPTKAKQLVKIISEYKAVIAARFHANIVSTALDIPSVALVWNTKMDAFSELIGCPERYIHGRETMMDPAAVVDIMEKAMEEGYNRDLIETQKKKTLQTMKNIVK